MTDLPTKEDPPGSNQEDGFFIRARFAGGRFDSHTIPFDVLSDLSGYRELVLEVAKRLYYDRNPDRKRLPNHFVSSFELGLSKVEGGKSAVAYATVIDPAYSPSIQTGQRGLGFAPFQEFEEARDLVDEFLNAIAANDDIPARFPKEAASRFNRFGEKLRPGEFIELTPPRQKTTTYTPEIRKKAILSVFSSYDNPLDESQIFVLDGGQDSANLIHLKDSEGRTLHANATSREQFEKAYGRKKHQVRLIGTGTFDKNDRLTRISYVEELIYIDEQPRIAFQERLDELAELKEGWLEEGAPAPSKTTIDATRPFLEALTQSSGISSPFIYPSAEGGVALEWTLGDWEISGTLEADSSILHLHALNMESDQEITHELDVAQENSVVEFIKFWNAVEAN
ncbi:hypothetical protein [uncultured Pseudoxanthomonas sp.]|uniref:hypothetical protein n=1 Tax=uncultured Pseudoxanthomonas sp. TaxID=281701 RepID=UPI00263570FF|nr:hypothetical protein [uncultured Pseudoxanthomonas sp.]